MKQKVALVLSGGGARGIAHIGVIEELENQGYEITSIAGTSMGSVVGGVYAAGKMEEFKEWLYTLDKRGVLRLLDFTFGKQGMVKGDKVFKVMKEFIGDIRIEDMDIPFAAVAADLIKKEEVVFRKGSIYDAMRASVSIPTLLTPVKMEKSLLVDGGVMNNLPISHVRRIAGDMVIAVYVNSDIPLRRPSVSKQELNARQSLYRKRVKEFQDYLPGTRSKSSEDQLGYFNLLNQTISLMTHHMTQMTIEKQSPDLMIEVSHDSCGTYDFYKAEEMVEMGRYAATLSLARNI